MLKKIKKEVHKDLETEDLETEESNVREYVFLPDQNINTFLGKSDNNIITDHPQAITVRIGQYSKSELDTVFLPPPYFIEFEAEDISIYDSLVKTLDYKIGRKDIQEIRHDMVSDDKRSSYLTEYQLRRSRSGLKLLDNLMVDIFEKLVEQNIVSARDVELLIDSEHDIWPPSDNVILGRTL